jgi:hypothetical protein
LACKSCGAGNQSEHLAEINVHLSARKDLHKAAVLVFPKLLVCLDCGSTQFVLPEIELRLLRESIAA